MGTRSVTVGILLSGVLLLGASASNTSDFDRAMEPILAEYLKIQTALAADGTEGVEGVVHTIEGLTEKLDPVTTSGKHTEHYKNIPADILAACGKFHEAKEIRSMREAFKDLSKPISMWVSMAKPEGKSVMYCPINPYFGPKMLGCGQKVGGAD
jgi:hypothetical protein